MSASGGGFSIAAGQANGQIAGAEGVAGGGGIHHLLFGQLDGRHFPQRLPANRDQAGIRSALHHHLFHAGGVGAGDHLGDRFFPPQRVFIVEGQKRDIGAGEHLLINLLRLRLAGPQARAIVVVEDHLAAVGAALTQQREQRCTTDRAENGEADTAQIEIVESGQLFANRRCAIALQPEFCRRLVAPVVEGALAGVIGFNVIQPRQAVGHPLDKIDVDVFLLPAVEHLLAERIGSQRGDVVDAQRAGICLPRDIDRSV